MSIFKLVSDSDTRFKNICLELLVVGFSIIGILDSSTERRVIGRGFCGSFAKFVTLMAVLCKLLYVLLF
jgi:hypothetical protein